MKYYTTFFINKTAILENIKQIKTNTHNAKFCAMVKANAYGHDLKTICKILKNNVDFFGVANIIEAKTIRRFDKETKILVVGKTDKCDYKWCAKNNVSITISSFCDLPATNPKLPLNIHIKIDTGLSRFGFTTKKEISYLLSKIKQMENLNIEGVFTHFATKENDVDFILKQYLKFKNITPLFNKLTIKHCANSFVSSHIPLLCCDMVRVGFSLYESASVACRISSKIINIKQIKKGDSVGYDRTFVAKKDMTIAVVQVGYADGLSRSLSNNFYLYLNGDYVKIIGNICMDICIIDITDTKAKLYDDVEILGKHITLGDYAEKLNTSKYEVMLRFNHARMNIKVEK